MPRILEEFPKVSQSRESAYNFDEWIDGRIWELTAGADYKCKSLSMQQRIQREAKTRGMKVQTRIIKGKDGKPDAVVFQFVVPGAPTRAPAQRPRGRRRS